MATTIDHLGADRQITVIRSFHDARGSAHQAGESGVIRRIALDFPAGEIVIEWERDGSRKRESMRFRLDAREGPRNGHMKEYFEAGAYALEPPPAVDPDSPIAAPWSLAQAGRFDEARARLLELMQQPHPVGSTELARGLAEHLGDAAAGHARARDWVVYDWLKDQAMNLWYHWGAGATSGGDGAARRYEMDRAERRFAELERLHARSR